MVEILSPEGSDSWTNGSSGSRGMACECWLFHQPRRQLAVLTLENGRLVRHCLFNRASSIASSVLPQFTVTLDAILRWRY